VFKALLIGCGNIGGLYDFENDQVQTHAKAYHQHPGFSWSVYDKDQKLAIKIAKRYNVPALDVLDDKVMKQFDCVSICTPTSTHSEILQAAFRLGIPVIICEKPLSTRLSDLEELEAAFKTGVSKVIVNYVRRFQPEYLLLKETINNLMSLEKLTNISIRYQRGFINNCSHALDLLFFLTGTAPGSFEPVITASTNDHFADDPTLSMNVKWNDINLNIHGLSNVKFSLFEIELYFEYKKIAIINAGDTILFMEAPVNERILAPLAVSEAKSSYNCLKNYMSPVIERAHRLLTGNETEDNFISALELNKLLLKTTLN
jgi:predicted dehydrogenase